MIHNEDHLQFTFTGRTFTMTARLLFFLFTISDFDVVVSRLCFDLSRLLVSSFDIPFFFLSVLVGEPISINWCYNFHGEFSLIRLNPISYFEVFNAH